MARRKGWRYKGAIYHLMNRGDRREAIFLADQDRELFLETLGESLNISRSGRHDGRGTDR